MKKSSVVFIALVLIINITNITCNASKTISCKNLTELCYYHEDCCSQHCFVSFPWFSGICEEFSMQFDFDSNSTDQQGICEFHMETDASEIDYLSEEFSSINAAHNSLPPYTLIQVSYKRRSVIITINDLIPRTNGTLLDLSNEAALWLQIKNEEFVTCKIEKVIHHNSALNTILYAILIFSCIVLMIYLS